VVLNRDAAALGPQISDQFVCSILEEASDYSTTKKNCATNKKGWETLA
jgi:hypothetical protein